MELNNEFEVRDAARRGLGGAHRHREDRSLHARSRAREVEGDEYRGVVKVKVGPITASYKGVARFEELDAEAHKAVLKAEGRETRGQGNATALITATLVPLRQGHQGRVATDLAITGKVAQFGRGVLADVSGKLLDQFVHNLESTVLAAPGAVPRSKAGRRRRLRCRGDGGQQRIAPEKPARSRRRPARRSRTKAAPAAGSSTESKPAKPATTARPRPRPPAPAAPPPARSRTLRRRRRRPVRSRPPPDQLATAEPVDLVEVAGGSVMKRLAPYLTVAGILLIARIVVYSLRRRRQ